MSRPTSIIGVYAVAAILAAGLVAAFASIFLTHRQAVAAEEEGALAMVEERRNFGGKLGKESARTAVEAVLDDFHRAASEADLKGYFRHLSPDAMFVGTDATERWNVAEFRAFTEPHFAAGNGWTYVPSARRVDISSSGRYAAFFEELTSEKYGELRGSGSLVHDGTRWRIQQYVLSFAVPNDVAPDLVSSARERTAADDE